MSLDQLEKLSSIELERVIKRARSIYNKRYYEQNKERILQNRKKYLERKKYGISG